MKAIKHGKFVATAAMVTVIGVAAACDLLDVEAPSRTPAEFLEDPANAELLVTSAIADFECAFAEYIVAGALVGNEMWDGQLAARMWPYDRRSVDPSDAVYSTFTCGDPDPGVYQTLQTARFAADNAARVLGDNRDAVSDADALIATALAYSGYSYLLLGEGMCSGAVDGGPEITSQGFFAAAEDKLTQALSAAASPDIANMARVGRARARLNQGNTSGALADAQQVPAGFVKLARYAIASFRSSNRVWTMNNRDERVSIENEFHDLQWKSAPDPRVTVVDQGRTAAADDLTPFWTQTKYPNQDSPIPIARYAEAQLIIAEIEGGQTAVDVINALHAAAGLPAYDPATDGPILDHVIQERERELFLESHHLYDIIRFNKSLVPAAGTAYQETGAKGGFYGSVTCLPLPLVERNNNPNIP